MKWDFVLKGSCYYLKYVFMNLKKSFLKAFCFYFSELCWSGPVCFSMFTLHLYCLESQ